MTEQAILTHAQEIGALKAEVSNMKARLEDMDKKLDQLVEAANMGKGAWWVSVKVGGVLVTASAGIAWIWGHLQTYMHR